MNPSNSVIVVVGGGAAGFFSAIHNQNNNPNSQVILIEKTAEVLAKVKISGGGRCNVTNAFFDPTLLCENYPRGGKELCGPFHQFQPKDTIAWFESHGVPLKIEADNRVFPKSDSSQSIIDCLLETATALGVKVWTECGVKSIRKVGTEFCLRLSNAQDQWCQKLILATGSSRSGYELAKELGHTIERPIPSLFTVKI
ncbi:MAG: aminoacetone oxidase family FAD-binding enzyme, partial [Candidatus Margulisbacteria bacterium]|nr:aminoacetone oxidase family FAD-binding enzyme [Candidatus Margulisiibacteriota bacterium]